MSDGDEQDTSPSEAENSQSKHWLFRVPEMSGKPSQIVGIIASVISIAGFFLNLMRDLGDVYLRITIVAFIIVLVLFAWGMIIIARDFEDKLIKLVNASHRYASKTEKQIANDNELRLLEKALHRFRIQAFKLRKVSENFKGVLPYDYPFNIRKIFLSQLVESLAEAARIFESTSKANTCRVCIKLVYTPKFALVPVQLWL